MMVQGIHGILVISGNKNGFESAVRDFIQQIKGITKGHFHIQKDQIWDMFFDLFQPLFNGCRFSQDLNSLTILGQVVPKDFPTIGFVLYNYRT